MPSIEVILVVTFASLALSASPGPSMLYVLSRSVGQSLSAGLASSFGLALGGMLLAIAAAFGLTTIFRTSDTAYFLVKFLGAAYLVYLGIGMILEKRTSEKLEAVKVAKQDTFAQIIIQGILVEFLNPKTILFFLAFIPQFVDPAQGSATTQMLILGMLVPLMAIPSDILVSVTGGKLANRIKQNRTLDVGLAWLGGCVLIGIGLHVFFSS